LILSKEPERVARTCRNAELLRNGLKSLGYDVGLSETAIVPVILGDERPTAMLARRLRDFCILTTPVVFPAVPLGSARLRLCATAAQTPAQIEFALDAFAHIRNAAA
jgi:glycine C-acetyltransferase